MGLQIYATVIPTSGINWCIIKKARGSHSNDWFENLSWAKIWHCPADNIPLFAKISFNFFAITSSDASSHFGKAHSLKIFRSMSIFCLLDQRSRMSTLTSSRYLGCITNTEWDVTSYRFKSSLTKLLKLTWLSVHKTFLIMNFLELVRLIFVHLEPEVSEDRYFLMQRRKRWFRVLNADLQNDWAIKINQIGCINIYVR